MSDAVERIRRDIETAINKQDFERLRKLRTELRHILGMKEPEDENDDGYFVSRKPQLQE